MNLIVIAIFLQIIAWTQATNATEDSATNKTKRTIANQVQTYGENRPVLLYPDNPGPPTFYAPVTIKPVFDPEVPKQVAAQQVLYEFQQTPTNAVSNVHVNQFYQPVGSKPESPLPANTGPAQFISPSESVAAPVQHSALIRHGQNFAQVQFQPQHIQTQQYVPGKYLYVNGKILYQPNQAQTQNGYQRPVNFLYMHPQSGTQKFIPQAPLLRPMGYRRFHPPQPHQLQKITKPMNVPEVVEEQSEEEPAEENVENNKEEEVEEEEENDKESEETDDDDHYFSKYSFDEDDDDHGGYREEDDDEDNERGSSRTVPKKHKKKGKPAKYSKSNNYKYSENYSTSSKYDKSGKKGKKTGRPAPKMHYKSVKYVKEGNSKPKYEKIEGKQSQNVPVVHKQKIFREKWFVTKSTDDSITK
ncbi:myb-like protein AA [Tribolium madens]|uniref:myb-like protein AA n=1 Tax=Tribolium madens TaxID=41895 RepID=UPI001CF72366|nr:myb-like protein AA [Tribolium madens]